jgi:predicted acyl esterase
VGVLLLATRAPGFSHLRFPAQIPMRDGKSLAADIYLPAVGGRWPAILIQTPYDKRQFWAVFSTDVGDDPLLKSPEYAFVVLDWRGFFASAGAAVAGADRGHDGYDAVEWIAAQSWCTGAVGSWGASALGKVQFDTAAAGPPHLVACVPIVAHAAELYELYFPGGVYFRNRNEFVASHFGSSSFVRQHPLKDAAWEAAERSGPQPEAMHVPMLHISGWYDHETAASMSVAAAIRERGGEGARGRQWLLVGPWTHSGASTAPPQQGELSYPAAHQEATREAKAFFDFYLRGIGNGWEERPFLRTFRINEDRWVESDAWPAAPVRTQRLFLTAAGGLDAQAPADSGSALTFLADPANPVPTLWGAIIVESNGNHQGPGDLAAIEARPDVLTFTTPPLPRPLPIEGRPTVTVWLACDAKDTDVAVRLSQVTPDGRSLLLVDGIRRASLRDSFSQRQLLAPGVAVRVPVELPPVAVTIPAGHALRVSVAPSNYDRFDVNVQDGSSFSDEPGATATLATVTTLLDAQHPSYLDLPVVEETRVRARLRPR